MTRGMPGVTLSLDARNAFVRKYVNKDVFKMILAFLNTVELRYRLYVRENARINVQLVSTARDGFAWSGSMPFGSPCRICMRPCIGSYILCSRHAIQMNECCCLVFGKKCQGGRPNCRVALYHTHLKCDTHLEPGHECYFNASVMAGSCTRKIHGLILPPKSE